MFLMDHLALVVSASDRNKMSAQNLATALAPPLILHSSIESVLSTTSVKTTELDYTQPISVLKYLLQIWPIPKHHSGNVLFTPFVKYQFLPQPLYHNHIIEPVINPA